MIRRPEQFTENQTIEADVVVVGAGPGGAAAAYKLASSGKKVVILESGGYFTAKDFSKDGLKALKNLYQDAGQRFTHGNAFFPTMFGKGVGGGTLVNSAISFRPPEKAIKRWVDEAQLKELSFESLRPYLDEVEKNVHIEVLALDKLGRNNTIFKDGVEKLSYRGAVIPRNTNGCVSCGICFFGCPSGAKQSVDKNFIASAVEKGADLIYYSPVDAINVDKASNRFESVDVSVLNPETGRRRARIKVKGKHLILAAGAVGTPQLLSARNLCNSSGQVGRNFRCHPSTGVIAAFDEPIYAFRSAVQAYYSDQFFDDDILLETIWAPPGAVAACLPGLGHSLEIMKDYKNLAAAGGMIREESSGLLQFDGSKVDIEYNINERDQKLLTRVLFHSAEIMFAAGAKTVYADNPLMPAFTSAGELKEFFAKHENLGPDIIREGNHGMGTCRMGSDPKSSVVGEFGRSHDVDNIWVMDVSAFPSALGVNPSITIMALALRGAEYLNGHFS